MKGPGILLLLALYLAGDQGAVCVLPSLFETIHNSVKVGVSDESHNGCEFGDFTSTCISNDKRIFARIGEYVNIDPVFQVGTCIDRLK